MSINVSAANAATNADTIVDHYDGRGGAADGQLQWDEISQTGLMTREEFDRWSVDGNLSREELTNFLSQKDLDTKNLQDVLVGINVSKVNDILKAGISGGAPG